MKKYLKIFLFLVLIGFSFYFTEKTANLVRSKDPIMQGIVDYADNNDYAAVNATIENDNYIIPGMYGKRVNAVKSLMGMKSAGVFNSIFLVTDYIKPEVSIENNKNKRSVI